MRHSCVAGKVGQSCPKKMAVSPSVWRIFKTKCTATKQKSYFQWILSGRKIRFQIALLVGKMCSFFGRFLNFCEMLVTVLLRKHTNRVVSFFFFFHFFYTARTHLRQYFVKTLQNLAWGIFFIHQLLLCFLITAKY